MEKTERVKALGKKYGLIYVSAAVIAVIIKAAYGAADADRLLWLLAPTARWVELLSGISFEYVPHAGYVSHAYRFLIAPSCAGIRFFIMVFLMPVFSFSHVIEESALDRTKEKKKGFIWLLFSLGFSYLFTVFVNGIRITLAVYLPILLEKAVSEEGFLTPEGLHTMIGAVVYCTSLCMLYYLTERIVDRRLCRCGAKARKGKKAGDFGFTVPVCWYFFLTVVFPFLGRLYRREWEGFFSYALLVSGSCLLMLFITVALRACMCRKNRLKK